MRGTVKRQADFGELREAFRVCSEIVRMNGHVDISRGSVKLSGIPRQAWRSVVSRVERNAEMVRWVVGGNGPRKSVQDEFEVVVSVLASEGGSGEDRHFEISALLVKGRGPVEKAVTVSSIDPSWREKLRAFVDWSAINNVIAAAEGNNQRAMIGLVLQLAGIGRGRLKMVEAEIPEEVDEATQSLKGADWLKSGLPRFETAAGEALWYLMRMRSVHARMIKLRKQGIYTSFGLAAMYASGIPIADMVRVTGMSEALVDKLTPRPGRIGHETANFDALGGSFLGMRKFEDGRMSHCADRVWKGAAIYARILDRRIRVGSRARELIGEGADIVSVAHDLGIARRDLIRVLSVRQVDAVAERERFVSAIIDPDLVCHAVSEKLGKVSGFFG